jgi:hypothetical protein
MNTVVINMDMLASRGIEALEGLWASLIWQARAEAVVATLGFATTALLAVVFARLLRREFGYYTLQPAESKERDQSVLTVLLYAAVFAVCVLTALKFGSTAFIGFFNPDYWALQQILGH